VLHYSVKNNPPSGLYLNPNEFTDVLSDYSIFTFVM